MPTFEPDLRVALAEADAKRTAICDLLRRHLGLERLGYILTEPKMAAWLRSITLGELLDSAPPTVRARRHARVPTHTQSRFDTRTQAGRDELDKTILALLRKTGKKTKMGEITKGTGRCVLVFDVRCSASVIANSFGSPARARSGST